MITGKQQFKLPINFDPSKAFANGFAVITLFIILLCVYSNSFKVTWQYDDYLNIVKNTNIRFQELSWKAISKSFYGINQDESIVSRPISYLSFGINYYFDRYNIWGYHVVNFLIHFISAIFLFLFIKATLRLPVFRKHYENYADAIALLVVFFWAPHPIHVTAVTYVVQRMASMAGMFYIISMYFFLEARTSSNRPCRVIFFGVCILSAILAFGSKENAVMLPFSLFLLDVMVLQVHCKKKIKAYWAIAVLILLFMLLLSLYYVNWSKIVESFHGRPFTFWQRLLTEPRVINRYISLLFYPISSRLTLLHDVQISTTLYSPFTTLPSILFLFGGMIGVLWWYRKNPFLAYCIIFFLLNHIIEGSVIALELIYEHRNYIPSMLLFVPVAIGIIKVIDYFAYRPALQMFVAFCTIFVLAAQAHTTFYYNRIFQNELTLWTDNVAKSPLLSAPHNNLGQALRMDGQTARAKHEFETALKLDRYHNSWQKGVVLYNLGLHAAYEEYNYLKALGQLEKASRYIPSHSDLIQHKALVALILGNRKYAENSLSQALKTFPNKYGLIQALGIVRLTQKRSEDAFYWAVRAHQMQPDQVLPLLIMAKACHQKKEPRMAITYLEKVMRIDPAHPLGAMFISVLYDEMREFQKRNRYLGLLNYMKKDNSWEAYWNSIFSKNINRFFIPKLSQLYTLLEKAKK